MMERDSWVIFNSFMTESLSYRNQSIDLLSKPKDWFLYDKDLRHESVNDVYKFKTILVIFKAFTLQFLFHDYSVFKKNS